jgi:hypothetical protein
MVIPPLPNAPRSESAVGAQGKPAIWRVPDCAALLDHIVTSYFVATDRDRQQCLSACQSCAENALVIENSMVAEDHAQILVATSRQ